MVEKSDKSQIKKISATEASRSFSKLLDEIEAGGLFLVRRHGREVCLIAPPPARGRRAAECLALLQARTPVWLDDQFERDMLDLLATESVEDRPSWG